MKHDATDKFGDQHTCFANLPASRPYLLLHFLLCHEPIRAVQRHALTPATTRQITGRPS